MVNIAAFYPRCSFVRCLTPAPTVKVLTGNLREGDTAKTWYAFCEIHAGLVWRRLVGELSDADFYRLSENNQRARL